ncbi:MAG TPA: EAL domain-containing protein [Pseudolysinimonas sp.]|nr:EAL domain-containing protein [Pseudolysinimonas sp.]
MRDLGPALDGAVARGEVSAVFQPQIDLVTGLIAGAESLCRWQHPEWGAIAPAEFIEAAEISGHIDELGRYMAEECCLALAEWQIDISVNVSPLQLENAEFTLWLAGRLSTRRSRGGSLTLEITESRPLDDVAAILRRLEPLRLLGVGIALDDLGTGYSSLAQLRRMHGTEVKLDRSLVADDSPEAVDTITEVVRVAHAAGIRVVAEGIETEEMLQRVTGLGCDRGQGYLLGRPMTRDAMRRLLQAA